MITHLVGLPPQQSPLTTLSFPRLHRAEVRFRGNGMYKYMLEVLSFDQLLLNHYGHYRLHHTHSRKATLGAVTAPVDIHTSMRLSERMTLALKDNALFDSGVSQA
jgi:hypothetical protein